MSKDKNLDIARIRGKYVEPVSESVAENKTRIEDLGINVKDFGAKGDGITDDYESIQSALDDCFTNNNLLLYFPSGVYMISKPLLLKTKVDSPSVYWWDGKAINIVGEHKATTRIIKYTNQVLSGVNPEVDNVDSVVLLFAGQKLDGTVGGTGTGINIQNMSLENQSTSLSAYSIYGHACQRMNVDEINIKSYNGMKLFTPFSSVFTNMVFRCTENAIETTSGGTSNTFRTIYSAACKNPYKIYSHYSSLDLVYADNCTGTIFDIGGLGLIMKNCGTESPKAQYIVKCEGSTERQVFISTLFLHRQTGDVSTGLDIADCAIFKSNRSIKVEDLAIMEQSAITGNSYIFDAISVNDTSSVDIGRVRYYKNFSGTDNPKLLLSKVGGNISSIGRISSADGSVNIRRNSKMPHIGTRSVENSFANMFINKAIYLDNATKYTDSLGNDNQYEREYNKGDLLLYNDPASMNALGLVVTDNPGTLVRDCVFTEVPINKNGTTASRPTTNLYVGLQYYDTTIGKPIWWSGTGTIWKDAMGTTV